MASSEYISREAALNLIDQYWQQAYNAHFLDTAVWLGSVYREVEDIPAADVRPVRRGEVGKQSLLRLRNDADGRRDMGMLRFCPSEV